MREGQLYSITVIKDAGKERMSVCIVITVFYV